MKRCWRCNVSKLNDAFLCRECMKDLEQTTSNTNKVDDTVMLVGGRERSGMSSLGIRVSDYIQEVKR